MQAHHRAGFSRVIAEAPGPGERCLSALLDRQSRRYGEREFLSIEGRCLSFLQCRVEAARFAGTLLAAGVSRGDRVAIMLGNRVEFIRVFLGCLWLGAIAVPLNIALRGAQLAHPLANSGARLLIIESRLAVHLGTVSVPGLEQVWLVDDPPASLPTGLAFRAMPSGNEALDQQPSAPGDACAILYTSGTTGPAKGVIYPSEQLYWWAALMAQMSAITAESVSFTTLPLFHIHALSSVVQCLIHGARCVITERFSASRYWAQAAAAGATHGCLVGSMGSMLVAQPPDPRDRAHQMHTIFASSLRSSVWAQVSARFGVARRVGGYGSTETNAVFFADSGWDVQGHMGHVVPGFHAQVVDEHDCRVPDGQVGELVMRSDIPFAFACGYWGNAEASVASWRNLWFHSGDLVVRESAGSFRFVGRLKESIRRRGENISAWEVEQALISHPGVSDAAAFGVQSTLGDEEVMAAVVLREGVRVEPRDLLRHLDGRLAHFAIPRFIEFVEKLPLTDTGKIQRTALRERGVTAATLDRELLGWKVSRD